MKNVEIKAKCPHPEKVHQRLLELGADFKGIDHQIDTYFRVQQGRLKLREGNIENALISYQRANQADAKLSEFKLYRSSAPELLKQMLGERLGIKVVVDKKRKIFFIDNVKFHIDEVESLGSFMEIEVTDMEDRLSLDEMQKTCRRYLQLLRIDDKDLVAHSYSDLLESAPN
jgi:adenylate cyclase class 2